MGRRRHPRTPAATPGSSRRGGRRRCPSRRLRMRTGSSWYATLRRSGSAGPTGRARYAPTTACDAPNNSRSSALRSALGSAARAANSTYWVGSSAASTRLPTSCSIPARKTCSTVCLSRFSLFAMALAMMRGVHAVQHELLDIEAAERGGLVAAEHALRQHETADGIEPQIGERAVDRADGSR